jgi:hypothetical protein
VKAMIFALAVLFLEGYGKKTVDRRKDKAVA